MPWILLGIGALAIVAVLGAIIAMRRGDQVNVNVAAQRTPTPGAVGVPVTVVVTATPAPTSPPPPTLIIPTQTPVVVTAVPKEPTAVVTRQPPPAVAPPPPAPPVGPAPQSGAPTNPTAVPAPTQAQPTAAPPPPTAAPPPTPPPFRGEVSPSGGLANTRPSFDGAYGAPSGETPARLVVYQRAPLEYQVLFSPEPPRALLVAARSAGSAPPLTMEAAQEAARRLLPNDAQRRTAQPEGNQSFVVERYHSNTLGQAIPADIARDWSGQAGDLMVIYLRASSAPERIERIIVAIGDNIDRARQRAGS